MDEKLLQSILGGMGGGWKTGATPNYGGGWGSGGYDPLIDILGAGGYMQLLGFNKPGTINEDTWAKTPDYGGVLDALRAYGVQKKVAGTGRGVGQRG